MWRLICNPRGYHSLHMSNILFFGGKRSLTSSMAAYSHVLFLVPCSFQGGLCLGGLCVGGLCVGGLYLGGLYPGDGGSSVQQGPVH